MTLDQRCLAFAHSVLRAYALNDEEWLRAVEELAEAVRSVTTMCTENLEHRRKETA
jgi:hypothetical protein